MPSACHEARSSPAPTTRSTRYDRQSTGWEALRDDTRPARARRRGERTRRAVLTSLSRNLRIEDPTEVGFLSGFGAVILIDVATQGRKAPVAKKYAAAAVWHATAAMSGADLPAGTMPLVFGMTLCEADPELIENTLSSLPRDAHPPAAAPREFAAHSARVQGTSSRAEASRRRAPRDGHNSHVKFRSIRRRNGNDL
jgi:hypothetical protein